MLNFLFILILHLIPLILLLIPFLLLFDVSLKSSKKNLPPKDTPTTNTKELEDKLNNLITLNQNSNHLTNLQKELEKTKSQTIASYMMTNTKKLKGFHLFQLIFTMIKNKSDDQKIIKVLHHYLPSCSNSHLYALLKSLKTFLKITHLDNTQQQLLKDLYNNKLQSTLIYLEKKLNSKLLKANSSTPSMQKLIIDEAAIYGLIFASFSEFHDPQITAKILELTNSLSPEIFTYWHSVPKNSASNIIKKNTPSFLLQKK